MAQLAYSHDVKKFADTGLQLNLPPDLVPATQYVKFSNAVSHIEGRLDTRDGTTLVCNGFGPAASAVHSIFRLVQVIPSVFGARLFGIASQLWAAPLPAGNVPAQLTEYVVANVGFSAYPIAFDGTPLSIASYRFDGDPQVWAIIANGLKMMKYKAGYYEQLGLPAPTVFASASAGSSGNLTGVYDWRYTYWNSVTQSESNPSPTMNSTPATTIAPTTFTNPDTSVGSVAFLNPGNAIDGNPATFAEGKVGLFGSGAGTAACVWFGVAPGSYSALTLQINSSAIAQTGPGAGPTSRVQLIYSLDGGITGNTIFDISTTNGNVTRAQQTDSIAIPITTDLSKLQVLMIVFAQAGGNSAADGKIYEINLAAQPSGGGSGAISLTAQSAIVCVTPPTDPQEDSIRLYRRGGTLVDNWWFVSQSLVSSLSQGVCGAGTVEIDDNNSDISIEANNTLALDNDMPVTSVQTMNQTLKAIWVYQARVLGCGDPNRPEAVYFSKNGNADEWPPENWIQVSEGGDEMMNGLVYATRCFAFSRERLYTLIPNLIQGITFSPFDTACRKGLKGRFAFCLGEKGIYFVSKDGIYVTTGGTEQSVIEDSIRPLFPTRDGPGIDVNGYLAPNLDDENGLRLAYHNGEIWFDYTAQTNGTRQTLIYDERRNRWRGWFGDGFLQQSFVQMHYSEPDTDSSLLFGTTANEVDVGGGVTDADGSNIQVDVFTGAYDQGAPLNLKEYGNVVFDIDPGGAISGNPVYITPWINGNQNTEAAIQVTGSGRQRVALPLADISTGAGLFGLNIGFDIGWQHTSTIKPILYQLDILWRVEPAAMQHWEVPPVALGQSGWWHMRDGYVTIRSAAAVTMTVTPDNGAPQTVTLPSTSGAKQKLYFSLGANKVKVVEFAFDSSADFRLYADENELRGKQWITKLGYQVLPFFGAESGGGAG